jgi:CDP-diacylglycerol--serine O-phosphatidyltransferase
VSRIDWIEWSAFGITLYAGLSMVTNAPFYSFKVWGGRRTVPFAVLIVVMLTIALVALDPPRVLFGIFCLYGLSGYVVYAWRKYKGRHASVVALSTDEPDEKGLHP